MCPTLVNEMLSPVHVSLVVRELCESTFMWREAILKITLSAKDLGEPLRSEVEG